MKTIQAYARWLKVFCFIFVLPSTIFTFLYNWCCDKIYKIPYEHHEFTAIYSWMQDETINSWIQKLTELPILHRSMGIFIDGIAIALFIWGFFLFIKLLSLYQQGYIFSQQTFLLLRKITRIAFAWTIYSIIKESLLSLILSLHNPVGQRCITISISSQDLFHIFFVGVLLIITSLIYEGFLIKKDQDLTI